MPVDFEVVDVAFRVTAQDPLPAAHCYPLYAALTGEWPWLHESEGVGVFPIRGDVVGGRIRTSPRSALRVRTPVSLLPQAMSLTGKRLRLGDAEIQVGVPRVLPLRPAASLYSRLVQIKLTEMTNGFTPEAFLHSANKQLSTLDIKAEPTIPLQQRGPRAGKPQRRVLHIKGERHVGFAMLVQGLTADESLRLQQRGLGGRRKMGCGLFLPVRGAR